MTKSATIMILCPMKPNDATTFTFEWAQKAIKMAKGLGYNVIVLEKNAVTYDNVTNAIKKYRPRMLASFSHGCPTAINGQNECSITRKYSIDQLMKMEPSKLDVLLNPVKLGNSCDKNICGLQDEVCLPLCMKPTNVDLLKDTIVLAVSCHTSAQLGRCAVASGCPAYIGYDQLLLFPSDDMGSQNIFGQFHVDLMKDILMGKSVGEAYYNMMQTEDIFIRANKKIKWLSLPMLWDRKHVELLGDPNATIY